MYSDEAQIFVFSKALGKHCKILGGREIKALYFFKHKTH
jgi:hypothetical protein